MKSKERRKVILGKNCKRNWNIKVIKNLKGGQNRMTFRTKIGKFYVERNRIGQIKKWVRIGRSLSADKRTRAKKKVKSGHGHQGDIR